MAPHPRPVRPEALEGDLIARDNALFGIVWVNPQRMSGSPCFYGTRVPVQSLFDYLRANDSVESFIEDFPGVTREQIDGVLRLAQEGLLARGRAA